MILYIRSSPGPCFEALMSSPLTENRELARALVSWKEIAAFLNRAERTVKRWERERGLPVHRVPGGERGSVFAYPDELREWLLLGGPEQDAASARGQSNAKDRPEAEETTRSMVQRVSTSETAASEPVHEQRVSRRWVAWMAASAAFAGITVAAVLFVLPYRKSARAELPGVQAASGKAPHVPSPQAEEFYLQGRYQRSLRTADSLAKSVDDFTEAIILDPAYAQAFSALAESYDLLPEFGRVDRDEAYARAKVAADKAITLDPTQAAGHRARAFALFYGDWDVANSDAEFRRALALDPAASETHHWYATTLFSRLEKAESFEQIDTALRLNPTSPAIIADGAFIHGYLGDHRESNIRLLRNLAETQPKLVSSSRYLAELDLDDGDYNAYVADVRRVAAISHDPDEMALATAAARGWSESGAAGLLEAARRVQQQAFERGAWSGNTLGRLYLYLGQPEKALYYFKAALKEKDVGLMTLPDCRCIANVRDNPDYASLLREVHKRMDQNSAPAVDLAASDGPSAFQPAK